MLLLLVLQVGHGIPQWTPATVNFPIIHPFDAGGPVIVVDIFTIIVVQTVRPLHGRTGRGSFEDIVHFTTISEGLDTSAQCTTSAAVPHVVVAVVVQIGNRFRVAEGTSAERVVPERW